MMMMMMNGRILIIPIIISISGVFITIVGGSGWIYAIYQSKVFDSTECTVLETLDLLAERCTWCDSHEVCYTCTDSDGNTKLCCNTHCDNIPYTCYSARWCVKYQMDWVKHCNGTEISIIIGHTQQSSGRTASSQSRNKALTDQLKHPTGSTNECFANNKNCLDVIWTIQNRKAWYRAFLSGIIILGIGFVTLFITRYSSSNTPRKMFKRTDKSLAKWSIPLLPVKNKPIAPIATALYKMPTDLQDAFNNL